MNLENGRATITGPDGYPILLSKQQESCINFKGDKTQLIVKGVAGSGKSIVLMAKAKSVINGFKPGINNEMAVFSYTNSLVKNAKDYLDPNEQMTDFATICTLESYIQTIAKSLRHLKDYPIGNFISSEEREKLLKEILRKRGKTSNHRFYRLNEQSMNRAVKFWLDEFEWMMGLGISKNDLDVYIATQRKGRGYVMNITEADKPEVFRIYKDYIEELRNNNYIEYLETHLFLRRHIEEIPDSYRFKYVFIDEAQDFPLIDIQIAIGLSRKGIMLAMDANQRLYKHRWSMASLGIKVTSRYLKQSFRCTVQIDQFAEALRLKNEGMLDQDDLCPHVIPEYEGDKPLVIETNDVYDEQTIVYHFVKEFLKNTRATTAIILRTREEVEEWSEYFASKSIKHDIIKGRDQYDWRNSQTYHPRTPGLKICTINSAKGLEFHNVIIPGFMNVRYPSRFDERSAGMSEDEWTAHYRNLAYVAMTRAKINLIITFYNKPSRFLDEIVENCTSNDLLTIDPEDNLFNFVTSDDIRSNPEMMEELVESTPQAAENRDAAIGHNQSKDDEADFMTALSAARSGDASSMFRVGYCFDTGLGTAMNRYEAIKWYYNGARLGDSSCQLEYSKALWEGKFIDCDKIAAMIWLKQSSDGGNAEAQYILASRLMFGIGCKQDFDEAVHLYIESAEVGNVDAIERLCSIHESYQNTPISQDQYMELLKKGSENNSAMCQYSLGMILLSQGDYASAFSMMNRSANNGNADAQRELGRLFIEGIGTEKNEDQGKIWIDRSIRTKESDYDLRDVMLSTLEHDVPESTSDDFYKSPSSQNSKRFDPRQARDIIELLDNIGIRYKDERTSRGWIKIAWHESLRELDSEFKRLGYLVQTPHHIKYDNRPLWVKIIRI